MTLLDNIQKNVLLVNITHKLQVNYSTSLMITKIMTFMKTFMQLLII